MSSLITKAFVNFSDEYLKFNRATIEQHKLMTVLKFAKLLPLGITYKLVRIAERCKLTTILAEIDIVQIVKQ